MKLSTVFLNFLLPPVSVYIAYGAKKELSLNILLTLLGWMPGIIHAFIITDKYVKEFREN